MIQKHEPTLPVRPQQNNTLAEHQRVNTDHNRNARILHNRLSELEALFNQLAKKVNGR